MVFLLEKLFKSPNNILFLFGAGTHCFLGADVVTTGSSVNHYPVFASGCGVFVVPLRFRSMGREKETLDKLNDKEELKQIDICALHTQLQQLSEVVKHPLNVMVSASQRFYVVKAKLFFLWFGIFL